MIQLELRRHESFLRRESFLRHESFLPFLIQLERSCSGKAKKGKVVEGKSIKTHIIFILQSTFKVRFEAKIVRKDGVEAFVHKGQKILDHKRFRPFRIFCFCSRFEFSDPF